MGDHTESFQVDFDPKVVSFEELLAVFWAAHDPTAGSYSVQYRSVLFYGSESQKAAAEKSRAAIEQERGTGTVKTALLPLRTFTLAEDYHQKYRLRHDRALMAEFRRIYPKEADFVNSTAVARANAWLSGEGTQEQRDAEIGQLGLSAEGIAILKESTGGLPPCPK